MGKGAFVLGILGSVVMGIAMSGRLVHRDYSANIVQKLGTHTTCPTFWVAWTKPPEIAPEGMMTCGCAEQPKPEGSGTPMHPPKDVHDAAAPMDDVAISYTEFTSLGGTKSIGLTYELVRGSNRQTFVISSAYGPHSKFAFMTAIPFVIGIVFAVLLGLIPKKKGAAD